MNELIKSEARKIATKWCEEDNQPRSYDHTYHGVIKGAEYILELSKMDNEEAFKDYCYAEQIDDETHQFDMDEAKHLWIAAAKLKDVEIVKWKKKAQASIDNSVLNTMEALEEKLNNCAERNMKHKVEVMMLEEKLKVSVEIIKELQAMKGVPHLDDHFEFLEKIKGEK